MKRKILLVFLMSMLLSGCGAIDDLSTVDTNRYTTPTGVEQRQVVPEEENISEYVIQQDIDGLESDRVVNIYNEQNATKVRIYNYVPEPVDMSTVEEYDNDIIYNIGENISVNLWMDNNISMSFMPTAQYLRAESIQEGFQSADRIIINEKDCATAYHCSEENGTTARLYVPAATTECGVHGTEEIFLVIEYKDKTELKPDEVLSNLLEIYQNCKIEIVEGDAE